MMRAVDLWSRLEIRRQLDLELSKQPCRSPNTKSAGATEYETRATEHETLGRMESAKIGSFSHGRISGVHEHVLKRLLHIRAPPLCSGFADEPCDRSIIHSCLLHAHLELFEIIVGCLVRCYRAREDMASRSSALALVFGKLAR